MNIKALSLFIVVAAALIIGSQSFFTVDQREQAIVLQLGQPRGEPRGPGLHFKTPFVQEVRYFDSRVLSIDPEAEPVVISRMEQTPQQVTTWMQAPVLKVSAGSRLSLIPSHATKSQTLFSS